MATAAPTSSGNATFGSIIEGNQGAALTADKQTWGVLLAAIGYAFATFGAQLAAFLILRWRLSRI